MKENASGCFFLNTVQYVSGACQCRLLFLQINKNKKLIMLLSRWSGEENKHCSSPRLICTSVC